MNIIIKFGETWTLYNKEAATSRILQPPVVDAIRYYFSNLFVDRILVAIQIARINPSRIIKQPAGGNIVLRFGTCWAIYDSQKSTTKLLDNSRLDLLRDIFSDVEDGQVLASLIVEAVNPAKLTSLPGPGDGGTAEIVPKTSVPGDRNGQ